MMCHILPACFLHRYARNLICICKVRAYLENSVLGSEITKMLSLALVVPNALSITPVTLSS